MRRFFLSLVSLIFAGTVLAQVLNQTCSSTVLPDTPIPPDALHSMEVVQPEYQPVGNMTALGYDYITPTINVVTTYPCNRGISSMVEVKEVRLIRYDPVTRTQKVDRVYKYGTGNNLVGAMWYRQPTWFLSGQPNPQPYITWINGTNFAVSVQQTPLGVWHWWGNPRHKAVAGYPYFVEIDLGVYGDTLVQVGLDYWKGEYSNYTGYGCSTGNNCEAYQSHWIGPTNGKIVTVRAPTMLYTY